MKAWEVIENEVVRDYFRGVLTKKIPAGKYVHKALRRHLNDLEKAKQDDYLYTFSHKKAVHLLDFFPSFLRHEGGKVFQLEPFQQAVLYIAYGWIRKDNGFRRFRKVYIEIPRKNGKTSLCGGLSLYHLTADNEYSPEVYFAATTREQASLGFKAALKVAKLSPAIKRNRKITRYLIESPGNEGIIKALSSEANSLEGLNVHAAITDEMHVHKSDEVINAIDQGMGARNQPMSIEITTAGSNASETSIGYEHHSYTKAVLDGTIVNDTWFGIIYSIDRHDKKKWADERTWHKANPGLGTIKKMDYMRSEFVKASTQPKFKPSFFIKDLNFWMQNEQEWIPIEAYERNQKAVDPALLIGKPCILGLDLSIKNDITSLAFIFPDESMQLDGCTVLWKHFIPEEDVDRRSKLDKVPYDIWSQAGHFVVTPGNVTDYRIVQEEIIKAGELYDVWGIGYDPYQATQMAIHLENDHGFELYEVMQQMPSLGPPTAQLERAITAGNMVLPDDPVAKWMFGNIMIIRDTNNNIKMDKKRSKEKIDCWPALVNAVYVLNTEDVQNRTYSAVTTPVRAINW
jgi:phage terminase large subunit-like protein